MVRSDELVPVRDDATARIPARSMDNPLISLAIGIGATHVEDLVREIAATEEYLKRLRLVGKMVGIADGTPTRTTNGHSSVHEPPPPETVEDAVGEVAAEEESRNEEPPKKRLHKKKPGSCRPSIADVKQLPPQAQARLDEADGKVLNGPDGEKPADNLARRKQIAEYLWKRGRSSLGGIISDLHVPPRIVSRLMDHEWFELADGMYTLTIAGKNGGLDDY